MTTRETLKASWKAEVWDISSFMDENYTVSLPGSIQYTGAKKLQTAWGRKGIEGFCNRIRVQISGGLNTRNTLADVNSCIKDTTTYGNSTLIISSSGYIRVSDPDRAFSMRGAFGDDEYYEKVDGGEIVGMEGNLYFVDEDERLPLDERIMDLDAQYFSLFFNADTRHPLGQSRMSPAIRSDIKAYSRNKMRLELMANTRSFPQLILNGVFEDMDSPEEFFDAVKKLAAGVNTVIGVPENPITHEKMDIEQWDAADPTPLLAQNKELAQQVAAAFTQDPSDFGVRSQNPASADALAASKEPIMLEIMTFTQEIARTLEAFLVAVADKYDEELPTLSFGEPNMLTKAGQGDFISKAISALPGLQFFSEGLEWLTLPPELAKKYLEVNSMQFTPEV